LPNWDEAKYYYFQAVDFGDRRANQFQKESGVVPITRDELVDDHYGWRWHENTHRAIEKSCGAATLGLLGIAYLTL
jgi:hypothetical protein